MVDLICMHVTLSENMTKDGSLLLKDINKQRLTCVVGFFKFIPEVATAGSN